MQKIRRTKSHELILECAALALRRDGLHGMHVAEIMKAAGLTHGGFYAHFASRDALIVETLELAGRQNAEGLLRAVAERRPRSRSALRALVEKYLSEAQLGPTPDGCPIAAVASEIPRQAPLVRTAAARRVRSLVLLVKEVLSCDGQSAGAVTSQMIGALQLARALGTTAQGKAFLAGARRGLLVQFDSCSPS
jgi:TetR/AcrR family transcriptional repressor of nem operon